MDTPLNTTRDRTAVDVSMVIVRIIVGLIFAVHGYQKVFQGGMQMMVQGMGPIGYLVSFGEFLGGIGIAVGFLARFSAASNIVIMLGAIFMVHGKNGFLLGKGPESTLAEAGFEYNLALIGLLAPVMIIGPGVYSIGRLLPLPKRKGTRQPILVLE
jgi:putative oxidoreductase